MVLKAGSWNSAGSFLGLSVTFVAEGLPEGLRMAPLAAVSSGRTLVEGLAEGTRRVVVVLIRLVLVRVVTFGVAVELGGRRERRDIVQLFDGLRLNFYSKSRVNFCCLLGRSLEEKEFGSVTGIAIEIYTGAVC